MKKYRIWSNEHNAWWKPNYCGYTQDINKAGVYTLEELKNSNYKYLIANTPKDEDFLFEVSE